MKAEPQHIKATGAAFRILRDLGFPHPREIDLRDLAMDRNVLVREGDMKGAEGRLLRKKTSGIIHIRKGITPEGRRRFTIAHELGHWELHENYSQFLCDAQDMRDYGRSPLEVEANHFAAELLMPASHFRAACEKIEPSMGLIESLSAEFETTLTATAIRFADTTQRKVVVVWYEGGIIRWSYTNPKRGAPFVIAGRKPPAFSSATLPLEDVDDGMAHYDDADWFPDLNWGKEGVQEETKRMPKLNAGLTLLWLP
jgi:Zn-dependent peptidase ImmA (M78 family)